MSLLSNIQKDSHNLWIQLAQGQGDRIPAHREALHVHSSCVRDLPEGDKWDLSNMVVEGQHVRRSVVIAWLEVVYQATEDERQRQKAGVHELLAFADAVGSSRRTLLACCKLYSNPIKPLVIGKHPEQLRTVKLMADRPYYLDANNLSCIQTSQDGFVDEAVDEVRLEKQDDFKQQLAHQMEVLLFQA